MGVFALTGEFGLAGVTGLRASFFGLVSVAVLAGEPAANEALGDAVCLTGDTGLRVSPPTLVGGAAIPGEAPPSEALGEGDLTGGFGATGLRASFLGLACAGVIPGEAPANEALGDGDCLTGGFGVTGLRASFLGLACADVIPGEAPASDVLGDGVCCERSGGREACASAQARTSPEARTGVSVSSIILWVRNVSQLVPSWDASQERQVTWRQLPQTTNFLPSAGNKITPQLRHRHTTRSISQVLPTTFSASGWARHKSRDCSDSYTLINPCL